MTANQTVGFEGVHGFLSNLFDGDLHAKRVLSLANATLGVIRTASLAVNTIGRGLALARGLTTTHAIKQVDRLLSNEGIDIDAALRHWLPYVVGSRIIERSPFSGCESSKARLAAGPFAVYSEEAVHTVGKGGAFLMNGVIAAVCRSPTHSMTKPIVDKIRLLAGLGVEGDAHAGATTTHLARLLRFGDARNLRQVHLIQAELFDDLRAAGFNVWAGLMGENITTRGIDLLRLPTGARLHLGGEAVIEVTGQRHPCRKLDKLQPGLMKATLERDEDGKLVRKAGIMSIVVVGGEVKEGDAIEVPPPFQLHPRQSHQALV